MKKINCSQIYSIDSISLVSNKGCAKLNSLKQEPKPKLEIIWKITEFPIENQGMPGSPFTVKVNITIFDKSIYLNKQLNGQFIYQIHSGTLTKYSKLGIPFGTFMFVASSTDYDLKSKIALTLTEESSKLIISSWI